MEVRADCSRRRYVGEPYNAAGAALALGGALVNGCLFCTGGMSLRGELVYNPIYRKPMTVHHQSLWQSRQGATR